MIDYFSGKFDLHFLGVLIKARSRNDATAFRFQAEDISFPPEQLMRFDTSAFATDLFRRTVVVHETRHFHDALLYPFGGTALLQRIVAAVNGLSAMFELKRTMSEDAFLPVPLENWLYLAASEREAFLAQQIPHNVPTRAHVPKMPVLDPEDELLDLTEAGSAGADDERVIVDGLRISVDAYRKVRDLWRSPHSPSEEAIARTQLFWEAAAIVCQSAAVEHITNRDCQERLTRHLLDNGPSVYRSALFGMRTIMDRLLPSMRGQDTYQARHILSVLTWSQMGSFALEMTNSSPVSRLSRLDDQVGKGLSWDPDASFTDLVAVWDEATGTATFDDLKGATHRVHRIAEKLERRATAEGMHHDAAVAMRAFVTAHEQMKALFLADPDAYVDPVRYIQELSVYPQPAIAVVHPEEEPDGIMEVWTEFTRPSYVPTINFETAFRITHWVTMADALFLEHATIRPMAAERLIKRYFGAQPLQTYGIRHAAPTRAL